MCGEIIMSFTYFNNGEYLTVKSVCSFRLDGMTLRNLIEKINQYPDSTVICTDPFGECYLEQTFPATQEEIKAYKKKMEDRKRRREQQLQEKLREIKKELEGYDN